MTKDLSLFFAVNPLLSVTYKAENEGKIYKTRGRVRVARAV